MRKNHNPRFSEARRQSLAIGKAKTAAGKRRAVLNWCRKIKDALGEGGNG